MRLITILQRVATPPPQAWVKNELFDAVFYLRIVVSIAMGMLCGALGAQGLVTFLSFIGVNAFIGNAWLRWQGVDETDWEDPDKISQSPLTYEGFGPSVSFFVLLWVVTFTMTH